MNPPGTEVVRRESHLRESSNNPNFLEEKAKDFVPPPVDIDRPRWDQSQFVGRLKHFARITNPLLLFKAGQLDHAAKMVTMAR